MFFSGLIQRKVAFLLQPWLLEEPQLELKLGFLRSHGVAENLRLDPAALNQLLAGSSPLLFKDFTVERLVVRVSNWSVPSFNVEVHGVHVSLSVGDPSMAEERLRANRPSDAISKRRKNILSAIDPEGQALHDALENISTTAPSRNLLATSFLNIILKNFLLEIHGIYVQMQIPDPSGIISWILEMKEISASERSPMHRCFLSQLFSAVIVPLREIEFSFRVRGLDISTKRKDNAINMFRAVEPFAYITLTNLQLVDFKICLPELISSFSPVDLPLLLACKLSTNESKHRSGRQLWKLASVRVGLLSKASRSSWHTLISLVGLWLEYVKMYQHLLIHVGYPAGYLLRGSTKKMEERKYSRYVKQQWKMMCEIENMLPEKAVAQARRVARYRAALGVQHATGGGTKSKVIGCFKVFHKAQNLLRFIWKIMYNIFQSLRNLFLRRKLGGYQDIDAKSGNSSSHHDSQVCFTLSIWKISITFSPQHVYQHHIGESHEAHRRISNLDSSLCLYIDSLVLVFVEGICEQSISFACGRIAVISSSVGEASSMQSGSRNPINSLEAQWDGRSGHPNYILCAQPAKVFLPPGKDESSCDEGACEMVLEKILVDMWLSWKSYCMNFEGSELQYLKNPWFLCEIKNNLIDPGTKGPDAGFWRCSIAVGKVNFTLEYSSILLISVLLGQAQGALCSNLGNQNGGLVSHSSRYIWDPPRSNWGFNMKANAYRLGTLLLRMLPEKHIQVGTHIAGLSVQVSLRNGCSQGGFGDMDRTISQHDPNLAFSLNEVEFGVFPTLRPDWGTGCLGLYCTESPCLQIKEHQFFSSIELSDETYVSKGQITLDFHIKFNGVNAGLHVSGENEQYRFLVVEPIRFQFSIIRKYYHSFSAAVVAFAAALRVMATGFSVSLYIDELSAFYQEIVVVFSEASRAFTSISSVNCTQCPELPRQLIPLAATEETQTNAEGAGVCMGIHFMLTGSFQLKSTDLILQNSRSRNNVGVCLNTSEALGSKSISGQDVLDRGICMSVAQICLQVSCEEEKMGIDFDLSGFQSVLFHNMKTSRESDCLTELRSGLLESVDFLHELSLSNCTLTLQLGLDQNAQSSGTPSDVSERLSTEFSVCCQKLGFNSDDVSPSPDHFLHIHVSLSEIFIGRCSLKGVLVEAHQPDKLIFSLSAEEELQTICLETQGGFLFLEILALVEFANCFAAYLHLHSKFSSTIRTARKHAEAEGGMDVTGLNIHSTDEYAPEALNESDLVKWEFLEACSFDMARFSVVLVAENECGAFEEIVLEADACLKFKLETLERKFLFELSCLSIFSQILSEIREDEITDCDFSSSSSSIYHPYFGREVDGVHPVFDQASCSTTHASRREPPVNPRASVGFHLSNQEYILRKSNASLSLENPLHRDVSGLILNQVWIGSGFVSGLDMTISLSIVKIINVMVVSLSGLLVKECSSDMKQSNLRGTGVVDNTLEEAVPDGSIVAIQDVHQHMYITVEGAENKYSLVGAIHYSLVGERALFRVKYSRQGRWKSPMTWFSLISLYAESDSRKPMQLCCRPGSGFVDISMTHDGGRALWRALPCKPKTYGVSDWDPLSKLSRNAFGLVNKKNDCGIAFVDGAPEFVRKPGNPFLLKVLNDFSLSRDVATLINHSSEASESNLQHGSLMNANRNLLPHIAVTFDNISLTIVDELPDAKNKFPLLKGCISEFQLIIQILSSKMRVMSLLSAMLQYFDAQQSVWRELVHPVETHIYYRTTFHIQRSDTVQVPFHFHLRIKELDINLNEIALDVLLFVIGKLNLAGPFTVNTSRILANCCKVENQSALDLLCHLNDNLDAVVPGEKSSLIPLRKAALGDQSSRRAVVISVQLLFPGAFSTSLIQVSLVKDRTVAWRTRVVSFQDPRSYPGPFVVIDALGTSEDGYSVVVSPLVKIRNETQYALELRFQRPDQKEPEYAFLLLKPGDAIDDVMAVSDAIKLSGGSKKALMSISVGNFLFSFRPEITESFRNSENIISVEWADDLKGGKAVRLSGIFEKLSYKMRKAFSVDSGKCSFSTTHCTLKYDNVPSVNVHFLIQSIRREVPVVRPDKVGDAPEGRSSPVALQEQKQIFILPTVRVLNLLKTEIHVLLSETDECATSGSQNLGNEATVSCGSEADLYANPVSIYFTVTLTAFGSTCKPVDSAECIKKLHKKKSSLDYFDIDLSFDGGKYFASLRLSRGNRGILEAAVFTPYMLKNDTEYFLLLLPSRPKPVSRLEAEKFVLNITPEVGLYLPPKTTNSWFLKTSRLFLNLLQKDMYEALLDLDALSGLTEIFLETESYGFKYTIALGLSLATSSKNVAMPSQIVTIVPRYLIVNESMEEVAVRQCLLEDETECIISIKSKDKASLQLRHETSKRRVVSLFSSLVQKHRSTNDDQLNFIQFRLKETEFGWSGPLCITSLGRFFLKCRRLSDIYLQQSYAVTGHEKGSMKTDQIMLQENVQWRFAVVNVVEEGSSLVVHFHGEPNINMPYRIENLLHVAAITYYQKDSLERDILNSQSSVAYVWDDLTLPHKFIIEINDLHLQREINLDKVRKWKPFFSFRQHTALASQLLLDKRRKSQERTYLDESNSVEMVKVGYEVYADGPTRVLRICEFTETHKKDLVYQSCAKINLRVSGIAFQLLEHKKQEVDTGDSSVYTPVIAARLGNIYLDSLFLDQSIYNQISIQSFSVDQKWVGAPSAAVLRRHRKDFSDACDNILQVVVILLSSSSDVTQVKFSTIILQPIELNLDEETLMRVVPFWRKSMNESNTKSRRFYFDHFEIHPIKIVASFLPAVSYTSYSTSEETLRSLLHSVIKIPAIKNMTVELNGVLVTHALITVRELLLKCAQHYSWYVMRAIYIAKGSPFLPPAFASIFDDLASSSLDVYFDPSYGVMNIPGLTLGTFKFISRCIHDKNFSGTKRYFGDLGKTLRTAGSNVMFAAVTEVSDSILRGAETSGFNGMVNGFRQGILKLAMEPTLLGSAFMEGGPDRKIQLDRNPGLDELYIEGYLQALLDTVYKQEYLRVKIIDDQVLLKNLPPNSSLIDEIVDRVKGFLVSKALLKGESSTSFHPLHHLRGESEWKIGPTVLTLCEHLFVSFAIRMLRKQANNLLGNMKWKKEEQGDATSKAVVPAENERVGFIRKLEFGKFVMSGMLAYIDGRLCRCIPNPIARRIVSGFLLSFLDKDESQ